MPHGHTTFQYEFRTHSAKIVQSVESNYLIQRYDWLFFLEYKNQLVFPSFITGRPGASRW